LLYNEKKDTENKLLHKDFDF